MKSLKLPIGEIEEKIGYTFQNEQLLVEAFTHSTYANAFGGRDNERMEYLGDAVLQLVVTEWQYTHKMDKQEGELTRERQKYVCEDALDEAVRSLALEQYLLISGGRANVGKKTVSSIYECVIAAIYLDGGYELAKSFILRSANFDRENASVNYKGMVQEFLQKKGMLPPEYKTSKTGKDNAPIFYTQVEAFGYLAEGRGGSKKQAEQEPAKNLFQLLKGE